MARARSTDGRAHRLFAGAAVLVVLASALLIATFGYGRDQGIYALVGRSVLDGDMPYRDAFDFKPPGIFLVYALARALFGSSEWGVRILEACGLLATSAAMVSISARLWGERTPGLIAAALGALVHAQLDFWHTAQPETFGGMLTIAAIWAVAEPVTVPAAARRVASSRLVVAGVAFGLAGLMKPPLAGGGAVLALAVGFGAARASSRNVKQALAALVRPASLVFAGGVVPFAVCLAWFAGKGALGELYEVLFVFTPHYTRLSWHDRSLLGMFYQSFTNWLSLYSSLVTLGLFFGLAAFDRCYRRRGVALLFGVVFVQLAGVALQGKFFPYHYAAVWPVTALAAGLGWAHVYRTLAARGVLGLAAFAAVVVLGAQLRTATKDLADSFWARSASRARVALGGMRDQAALDTLASVADVSARGNRQVAEELARRVRPGSYLYVFGFEPVIYELSGLVPASRYIYNVPQRVAWASDASRAELMRELAARPPAAIVVAHGDVFPMVTGNARGSGEVLEREFFELGALIHEHYRWHARIDDFDLYLQR